ncbi:MAG: PHP-associated domain-containing protein [Nitrospirota bacterium]
MKRFLADLHIHTCLSPCAELDMTPRRIIEQAERKGVEIIAIADHNSAENTAVAVALGRERGITVLPALELTSSEEAHLLALFGTTEQALAMQAVVYRALPEGSNDERAFGYQLVVNEQDEILEFNKRLFFAAADLPLKALVDTVHSLGGLAVASHIDREYFSVISQLGFIPPDLGFDALEISYNTGKTMALSLFGEYRSLPWITSSDAHHLDEIGRRTTSFLLREASFEEMASALKGERELEWNTE